MRLVAPPSAIAEEAAAGPVVEQQTRAGKSKARILTVNRPNPVRKFLIITLRTLVLAALAALVVLIVREPANVPAGETPLPPDVVTNVRAALLRNAQTAKPFDAPWGAPKGGLNAYLSGVLATAEPDVTAVIAPAGNGFKLFVRHKVGPLHIYTTTGYQLVARGNGLGVTCTGAALGRLPVPLWARSSIESWNAGIVRALEPDLEVLRNAAGVRISDQQVHVSFGGAQP